MAMETHPIPEHLRTRDWYAPHLAWLRGRGMTVRHDPGDAAPRRANLGGANLGGADLRGADLRGAYLVDADFVDADLSEANLEGADLGGADLRGADLGCATMPDGRTWDDYRADHMAGICDTDDVRERAIAAWGRHTWANCPMHAALDIVGLDEIADVHRRILVACWVALYDAGLLPEPEPSRKAGA